MPSTSAELAERPPTEAQPSHIEVASLGGAGRIQYDTEAFLWWAGRARARSASTARRSGFWIRHGAIAYQPLGSESAFSLPCAARGRSIGLGGHWRGLAPAHRISGPRAVTGLRRCRAVWGETTLRQELPGTDIVSDAVYVPCRHDGPWGLFSDGKCLAGTGQGLPEGATSPEPIETVGDATYLYIGPLIRHYGHFITDTLSRAWPLAAWEGPLPKLLCHPLAEERSSAERGFIEEMLAGLGLETSDLVSFDRPVRIPRVIVPEPSFATRSHTYAVFGELCRSIGRRHWQDRDVDRVARPAYLAKTRLRNGIGLLLNEERVVAELDRRGVEIVHPETLGFGEQVHLFATRRTVLGTAGSAFHTSVFSAPGRRILGLNWAAHLNANFPLLDALAGNQARYYWADGTTYETEGAFGIRWTVPEPERVAAELLERVEAFEELDARDAAEDAARARQTRSLGERVRRWRRRRAERRSHRS